jgi:hypothetical protein
VVQRQETAWNRWFLLMLLAEADVFASEGRRATSQAPPEKCSVPSIAAQLNLIYGVDQFERGL